MYIGLRGKYPLFMSDLDETWIFWTDFRKKKNPPVANFKQIRPVVAELFRANGRDEANGRFHSSANVPKIWFLHSRRDFWSPTYNCFSKVSMHPTTADNQCLSPLLH